MEPKHCVEFDWSIQQCGTSRDVDLTAEPADDKQCAVNSFEESDDTKSRPPAGTKQPNVKIKQTKPKRGSPGITKAHGSYKEKNQKGIYKCTECNSTFATSTCLGHHKRNLHYTEQVTCDICQTSFKSKNYLRTHMSRVHYDDGKQHQCRLCQKAFRSPRYLSIHVKNSHKRGSKYRCCAQGFDTKKYLDLHIKKDHAKERVVRKLSRKALESEMKLDVHNRMNKIHVKEEQKRKEEKREVIKKTIIKREEPDEFEVSVEEETVGFSWNRF